MARCGRIGSTFDLVLANRRSQKSSVTIVSAEGKIDQQDDGGARGLLGLDVNKQLNFVQHMRTLLKIGGQCAVVVRITCCSRVARRDRATQAAARCNVRCFACRPESSMPRA